MPDDTAGRYGGRIVDLVSLLLETGDDDIPIDQVAVRSTIYSRCVMFVENHLADPDLSPERIAAALGISVRYLHKIFQRSGESVCDFIRRARLKESYRELTDAGKNARLVKEIAARNGFRSQAHFASTIKRFYGVSPTEIRARTSSARRSPAGPAGRHVHVAARTESSDWRSSEELLQGRKACADGRTEKSQSNNISPKASTESDLA